MDIRKIRHVTVLAAERNFVRAAARLSITQSALSHSIARLEEEIGLALFDRNRSGNGASLTGAGREFVKRAEYLLIADGGLASELTLLRKGQVGHVACGLSPIPASLLLRPVMLDMVKSHPALRFHVELNGTEHLLNFLLLDEIEFFFTDSANIEPGKKFLIRHLARVHVDFHVRKGHPLASRTRLTVADLKAYPVLAPRSTKNDEPQYRYWLGLSETDPLPVTMTCDDFVTLRDLALDSDSVLLAARSAVSAECGSGKLVRLSLDKLRHQGISDISLVSLAKKTLSPAAKIIISRVETMLTEQGLQSALP